MNIRQTLLFGALLLGIGACGSDNMPLSSDTYPAHQVNSNGGKKPSTASSNAGNNNGSQPTNPPNTGSNNGSQPTNPPNTGSNNGSQPNNPPSTGNNNGSQPTNPPNTGSNNGSQPNNPPSTGNNNGSQPNNPPNTGNNNGSQPNNPPSAGSNNGSQPNNPPNTGSNTPSEFQVNPPSAAHKAELDKAIANTNKLRQDKGLPPLKYDPALAAYAQKRAEEIVQLYEHQRPNGQSWKDGVKNGAAAENITAGYGSADKAVLEQWRNSAGHYKNMTNAAYTRIGIGLVHVPNSPHGYYWVQIFGDDNTTTDYRFNNGTSSRAVLFRAVAAAPAPDVLYLDGEAVPLLPQGKRDWHAIDAANHTGVFGGNTQYSRYGIVKRHDDDRYRAFSQGLPTPLAQMPQSGSVRYLGQGVAASGMERQYFHADLRADFDRKALHGTLSGAHGRLDVNALIRGNTFATPDHAEVCAKGGFYGTHASELSGTFDVRADGRTGAFGAVRQGD